MPKPRLLPFRQPFINEKH
jgi:hypothetical protein